MIMRLFNKALLILIISLTLFACSRVTQENFNKLQQNMTVGEVTAILGEPTSSDSVNIAGISGTSTVWKSNQAEITIQFINDKLIAKSFNKSGDQKNP